MRTNKAKPRKKLGIYLHIPFCLSKCLYCGFYSRAGTSPAEREAYIDALLADICEYAKTYGDDYTVDTVFIGGGTPSVLTAEQTERILAAVFAGFQVEPDAEITIESNPKTLTRDKLTAYRRMGINRLSVGLQSFDPQCLQTLGRVHTPEDFLENFWTARDCGFDNINVDLMFAVPGHTMAVWTDTLENVIRLSPEHISFYSLQIEEGTPFYDLFTAGKIEEIPDETDRQMYHRAVRMLTDAGYTHYEISNCAKPGFACRHNLKYWSMDDYLGIGSGASSYMQGIRFAEAPVMEFHQNTFADEVSEFVFTGLRKTCGISFAEFEARYGRKFWDVFADRRQELSEFLQAGQLIETEEGLRLSLHGIDISNAIMAVFV